MADSDLESYDSDYDIEDDEIEELREKATTIARNVIYFRTGVVNVPVLVQYLTTGHFKHVWRVHYTVEDYVDDSRTEKIEVFILRICREDAPIKSHLIRNEVGCLNYISRNLPDIPVPKVLAWDDGSQGSVQPFIAESFIEGQRLSNVWPSLTSSQKKVIEKDVANVVVDLTSVRFQYIGGFTPEGLPGPLVEKVQVFKGREKFYAPENFNIGPYNNPEEYIVACYFREICYWANANLNPESRSYDAHSVTRVIDARKGELIDLLLGNKDDLITDLSIRPWVLFNENFNAKNMIVHNDRLVGIIDWKFSGVYPMSWNDSEDVFTLNQNSSSIVGVLGASITLGSWRDSLDNQITDTMKQRGWNETDINLVTDDEIYRDRLTLDDARAPYSPSDL